MQELMNLFASGQANVRDHDENGWSLLHVSVAVAQIIHVVNAQGWLTMLKPSLDNPPICQFFVETGLDIDETVRFGKDGTRGVMFVRCYKTSMCLLCLLIEAL